MTLTIKRKRLINEILKTVNIISAFLLWQFSCFLIYDLGHFSYNKPDFHPIKTKPRKTFLIFSWQTLLSTCLIWPMRSQHNLDLSLSQPKIFWWMQENQKPFRWNFNHNFKMMDIKMMVDIKNYGHEDKNSCK